MQLKSAANLATSLYAEGIYIAVVRNHFSVTLWQTGTYWDEILQGGVWLGGTLHCRLLAPSAKRIFVRLTMFET